MKGQDQHNLQLKQLIPGNCSKVIRELSAGSEQDGGFDTLLRC